ncbi:hypothetical protein EfmJHP38_22140 [Enterococcus faecium]|nr:hypothetical protein EfmJHP38_22140 [Enterococcus faecium]
MEREPKKITSKAYRCHCRFLTPDTEFDEDSDYINNTIKKEISFSLPPVKRYFHRRINVNFKLFREQTCVTYKGNFEYER